MIVYPLRGGSWCDRAGIVRTSLRVKWWAVESHRGYYQPAGASYRDRDRRKPSYRYEHYGFRWALVVWRRR